MGRAQRESNHMTRRPRHRRRREGLQIRRAVIQRERKEIMRGGRRCDSLPLLLYLAAFLQGIQTVTSKLPFDMTCTRRVEWREGRMEGRMEGERARARARKIATLRLIVNSWPCHRSIATALISITPFLFIMPHFVVN